MRATGGESKPVSATEPDWSREAPAGRWDPGRRLLRTIRRYQHHRARRGPLSWIGRKWNVLLHRFWSAVSGAEIPLNAKIAGGFMMPHPNGIVIHPDAVIGPNCLFFQQVTVGGGGFLPGVPTVGGHVDIGAGAKVLGGVRLGDHCKVGPNAVVLHDVAPGTTVMGEPAQVISRKRAAPAADE